MGWQSRIHWASAAAAIMALLGAGANAAAATQAFAGSVPTPSQSVSADFFPIGVFSQPTSSFAKWQSRGVNTVVAWEAEGGNYNIDQWSAAARAAGLYMIRQPSANLAADNVDSHLLAFLQPDEPEINQNSPASLQATYAALKSAAPSKPVWLNLSGGWVAGWQGNLNKSTYQPYLAAADWVSADIYPVTGWNNPGMINIVGKTVARLTDYSGGKPAFAFIETSNQQLPWVPNERGVSSAEFRGEVWDSIINGAKGIVYFPQQISGFNFDGTPSEVQSEMTKQDGVISKLARVLNSERNPSGTSITASNAAIEGSWRIVNGIRYYIVLNDSANSASGTLTLTNSNDASLHILDDSGTAIPLTNGQFSVNLNPFEYHIYTSDPTGQNLDVSLFSQPTFTPAAVPEPMMFCWVPMLLVLMRRPSRQV